MHALLARYADTNVNKSSIWLQSCLFQSIIDCGGEETLGIGRPFGGSPIIKSNLEPHVDTRKEENKMLQKNTSTQC